VIDPKLLRNEPEEVARNLARRGYRLDVEGLKALEDKRKPRAVEVDRLRAERNASAKAVGMAKGRGEDAAALIARGEALTAELAAAEGQLDSVQRELEQWQLELPNLLHSSVPDGSDERANAEVRRWGEPRALRFKARDHVEIGERLGGLDFEAAARISGARFVVMRGAVARLHRAGYIHGDLTPYNIFVVQTQPPRFIFLDHDRTRRGFPAGRRYRQLRNLVQLGRFDLPGLSNADRLRVFRAYADGLGLKRWHAMARRVARMLARRRRKDMG
jgi:hypothetical protein